MIGKKSLILYLSLEQPFKNAVPFHPPKYLKNNGQRLLGAMPMVKACGNWLRITLCHMRQFGRS